MFSDWTQTSGEQVKTGQPEYLLKIWDGGNLSSHASLDLTRKLKHGLACVPVLLEVSEIYRLFDFLACVSALRPDLIMRTGTAGSRMIVVGKRR